MILLRPDCLVFEQFGGEAVPCSAEEVTIELMGAAAGFVDETVIENAAQGVLHYFKEDLGQTSVSVEDFSKALEKALRGLGFDFKVADPKPVPARVAESDLRRLVTDQTFELVFFQRLRDELRHQLQQAPEVIRFHGLRSCVKVLAGAKRWGPRCQGLQDQIVNYIRTCLGADNAGKPCALVVH